MAFASYEELERRRKERQSSINGEKTTGTTAGGFASYEELERRRKQRRATELATSLYDDIETYLNDSDSYIRDYTERFGSREDGKYVADADAWLGKTQSAKTALNTKRDSILSTLDLYGEFYDPEWVKNVRSALSSNNAAQEEILGHATQDRNFWNQFTPNEDQKLLGYTPEKIYGQWHQEEGYRQKHQGKSYTELMEQIGTMEDGDEKDWLKSYAPTIMTAEDYDRENGALSDQLAAAEKELSELYNVGGADYFDQNELARIYELQKLIPKMRADLNVGVRKADELRLAEVGDVNSVSYDPEFATLSAYDPGITDGDYTYLNMDAKGRSEFISKKVGDAVSVDGDDADLTWYDHYEKLKKMSVSEIAAYNYWFKKEGAQKAQQYLDTIMPELEKRQTGATLDWAADYAEKSSAKASALSVLTSLGAAGEFVKNAANYIAGDEEILGKNLYGGITNTIRDKVSEKTDWMIGDWDAHDFLYNTVMSGIDSAAAGLIFGKAGGVVLGLSAAANGVQDGLSRGMSNEQAFWNGIFAGVFEGVFETYSIGSFKSLTEVAPKTIKDVAKNLGKSMLVNASEEALTEIANITYDTIVNGEFANYTPEELANGAWKDAVLRVIESGASGALMGFGFGSAGNAVGYVANRAGGGGSPIQGVTNRENYNTGKALFVEPGRVDALKELALTMAQSKDEKTATTLRELAEKVVSEHFEGKGLGKLKAKIQNDANYRNTGKLYNEVQQIVKEDPEAWTMGQNRAETAQEGTTTAPMDDVSKGEMTVERLAMKMAEEEIAAQEAQRLENAVLYDKDPENPVEVAGFVRTDGNMQVKLADGRTVAAAELSFPDSGTQELYRVITEYAETEQEAQQILDGIPENGIDKMEYARGVEEAYLYGQLGMQPAEMDRRASFVQKLDPQIRQLAYDQGLRRGLTQTKQAQARVDAAYNQAKKALQQMSKKGTEHTVRLAEGVSEEGMEDDQLPSYELAKQIAPAVKADITVYNGGREWGYYDPKTDTICLNLNAKWNGVSMMSFTLAHELVHRAKLGSAVKYRAFVDFLMAEYGKQGADVNAMVNEQLKMAKENGIEMTYPQAFEEVICDACQKMLVDTNAGEKLAEFGAKSQENKSILQEIGQLIKEMMDKLRRVFRNVEPDSIAAKEFQRFDENVKQALAKMFVDMTVDAGEKLSTIKDAGMTEKITTDDGGVKYKIVDPFVDTNGVKYDSAVLLDTEFFDGLNPRNWVSKLREFVEFRAETEPVVFPIIDEAGNVQNLEFAKVTDRVRKTGKAEHKVLSELSSGQDNISKLAVIHIDEIVEVSEQDIPYYTNQNSIENHGWLDKKGWLHRTAYVINAKNGNIYKMVIDIAKAKDGRHILFATKGKIKKVGNAKVDSLTGRGPTQNSNSRGMVPYVDTEVKRKNLESEFSRHKEKSGVKYKLSDGEGKSNRQMLVDIFEQMVTSADEYKALEKYRKNMDQMLALEEQVDRLTAEIKRISFSEGPRNMEYLNKLKALKQKAINDLNRFDNILLGLEKSGVLKAMIDRNRQKDLEKSYDKAREYYQESKKNELDRKEKTFKRQQIKRTVRDLWKLQERAPKHRRTKEELREFVDKAIKAADLIWLERYDEYDMVRNGIEEEYLRGDEKQLLQECRELLEKHLEVSDADNRWDLDAALQQAKDKAALDKELGKRMKILRDKGVFAEEYKRRHEVDAGQILKDLIESYEKLRETESPYLANAYQEKIQTRLQEILNDVGVKPIRNMTLEELEKLHEAYSAVLHVVRNANKLFADERAGEVTALGTKIVGELQAFATKVFGRKFMETMRKVTWNNMTPAYVFRRIGSATMERLYKNLVKGMGTYGTDIAEAKVEWQKQAKKYGAHDWDMEKRTEFVDKTGKKFSLSLGQLMSLYALSRRQQALGHIEIGGIRIDSTENYVENVVDRVLPKVMRDANAFKLDKEGLDAICKKLTAEQRTFVEVTQGYLSTVMAEKGNEVSMKLYGIRLFREKVYFPLRTANDTRYQSTELFDQNKLKNSGFTKETNPNANNAVVLSDYSKVWTGHVKQMSLYHGMTLAMEDMDRVLNFGRTFAKDEDGNILRDEKGNPVEEFEGDSISATMKNIWGEHPENYVRELMQRLNGGVRADDVEAFSGKMLSRFKKAAVAASLSVWIQQWTSVFRAMAHIPMKYFFQKPMGKYRATIVAEMKKYCPVAIIKEMGGFDTGMGSSEHDYITMRDPENPKELLKEIIKHPIKRIDELAGWLPARADETTWAHIWTAVKRETVKNHPQLKPGSEEFYKVASDRFTEVINLTQVYDSALSKSALMRHKGTLTKMLTQFASEPTVALNMAVDAMVQMKRTGKAQDTTALALAGSIIANAMSSALIYAVRDDDEDETFLEKYSASLFGNLLDGFNPLTYMPIIRDIWSTFQGYDVKRSDMEIWGQLVSALEKVVRKYADEDATDKERAEAWAECADWVLALFGVPEKNARRELKGLVNLWNTLEADKTRNTTSLSVGDVLEETWWSSVPFARLVKRESKKKKLLDACVADDAQYVERLRATYKTEKDANNAIAAEIKERFKSDEVSEKTALEYLTKYAGKSSEKAQELLDEWGFKKAHPDTVLTTDRIQGYITYAEPVGISQEIYNEFADFVATCSSDKDENGKTIEGGSERDKVLAKIDAMPLTDEQKDALYYKKDYAESKIDEAPWH